MHSHQPAVLICFLCFCCWIHRAIVSCCQNVTQQVISLLEYVISVVMLLLSSRPFDLIYGGPDLIQNFSENATNRLFEQFKINPKGFQKICCLRPSFSFERVTINNTFRSYSCFQELLPHFEKYPPRNGMTYQIRACALFFADNNSIKTTLRDEVCAVVEPFHAKLIYLDWPL